MPSITPKNAVMCVNECATYLKLTTQKKVREETPEKTRKPGGSVQKRTGKSGNPSGLDVSKALEPLIGKCATLHHEYWSYTWCHRGTVMQASFCSLCMRMKCSLSSTFSTWATEIVVPLLYGALMERHRNHVYLARTHRVLRRIDLFCKLDHCLPSSGTCSPLRYLGNTSRGCCYCSTGGTCYTTPFPRFCRGDLPRRFLSIDPLTFSSCPQAYRDVCAQEAPVYVVW